MIDSYRIVYSGSDSAKPCDNQIVPPSDCNDEVCHIEFNVTSSKCGNEQSDGPKIYVAVYVTTNLGDGPMSDLVKEGQQHLTELLANRY